MCVHVWAMPQQCIAPFTSRWRMCVVVRHRLVRVSAYPRVYVCIWGMCVCVCIYVRVVSMCVCVCVGGEGERADLAELLIEGG
jgi:hypothetical protein